MKISQIDPTVTEHRRGRARKVGNWSFLDLCEGPHRYRHVWHYNTLMVGYVSLADGPWFVGYLSVGRGSVSDQGGVNKLVRHYGFRFDRDMAGGGPRIVNLLNDRVVADVDGPLSGVALGAR